MPFTTPRSLFSRISLGGLILAGFSLLSPRFASAADRPNFLWLTSEDNSPHLGCYGDPDATTPNLDALAKRSLRFQKCWSVSPVCAPARTTLILGRYPSSLGAEHMRSLVKLPDGVAFLPQLLRAAGYYCTNNAKEDYNVTSGPGKLWDESSKVAHYDKRAANQPFFAVFNHLMTHESATRKRPHTFVHDPEKIHVPPQHPDLPEVRKAWAQVADQMTIMDTEIGSKLKQLGESGLADDTIIFYFGDHGTGLARSKRYPGESGLRVPLIVHFPEKWKHLAPADYSAGGSSNQLVSFVDFAPTLLSVAGVEIPPAMQGMAFAGKAAGPAKTFNYGLRGRMDECYDLARSVTDGRYVYIKNYYPDVPWGDHNTYMFITPLTQEWFAAFQGGKLKPEHARYWLPKGPEELYDLQNDPGELKNLASDAGAKETLAKFRQAQHDQALKINDIALVPEAELLAQARAGAPGNVKVDVPAVLEMANAATNGSAELPPGLEAKLRSPDAAIRFWAVDAIRLRGAAAVTSQAAALEKALKDSSPNVRLTAAATLAANGSPSQQATGLALLLSHADVSAQPYFVCVAALNYWDRLPKTVTKPHLEAIGKLSTKAGKEVSSRSSDYLLRLQKRVLGEAMKGEE